MGSLAAPDYRGHKLDFCSLGQVHDLIHHLVHGLLHNLFAAFGTVGDTDARVEKTKIVVDFRNSSNCRTGVVIG